MTYLNSDDQKEQLQKAMQELKKRGHRDIEVVDAIDAWVPPREKQLRPTIHPKTYARYRADGITNRHKGELLFDFFCRGPIEYRVISVDGLGIGAFVDDKTFVESIRTRFASARKANTYDVISSLVGSFELYRRSWQIQDGKHFVKSLLKIEKLDGLYRLTEAQEFLIGEKEIDETDEGFIFPYATNFFAITNSPYCMKFYDFHEVFPEPSVDVSAREIRGNLLAISGKGEHPSYRFLAKRSRGAVDMEHHHIDEFKDNKEMEQVFNYIFS